MQRDDDGQLVMPFLYRLLGAVVWVLMLVLLAMLFER